MFLGRTCPILRRKCKFPPKFSKANLIPPIPAQMSEKVKFSTLGKVEDRSGYCITIVMWTGKYFKVEVYKVIGSYTLINAIH